MENRWEGAGLVAGEAALRAARRVAARLRPKARHGGEKVCSAQPKTRGFAAETRCFCRRGARRTAAARRHQNRKRVRSEKLAPRS